MLRFTLFLLLLAFQKPSFALEKQTRRHSMCGVEKYMTLYNDPRCPVDQYILKVSSACKPIYKFGTDMQICGPDPLRKDKICVYPGNPRLNQRPDPDLGCGAFGPGYRLVENPVPGRCRNEKFGFQEYEACRDPSHNVESYQACSRETFPVESYNECSFYKTPEELVAYIDATAESLETYRLILPERKADLFSRTKDERAFACLINDYKNRTVYEALVEDLAKKYLLVFGYKPEDAIFDCDATSPAAEVKFTIGSIDCDNLTLDTISTLSKPDGVSDTQFSRFKQNCTLKKSHDSLIDWFDTKRDEIGLLMSDLAAANDPNAQTKLKNLKTQIDDSI